jgi:glycosyltransferase involved in cell wall biosynthesis
MSADARTRPFFSIIIPTYQRAHLIGSAVESVLAQTFTDWELIIIDDGSTDGTAETLGPLLTDPRIQYHWQPNAGRSAARNRGIDRAVGGHVCFLDSDDMWLPHHLAVLHRSCVAHPGPAMHHTRLIWHFPDGDAEVPYNPRDRFYSDVEYVLGNELPPDVMCIERMALGTTRFDEALVVNEDHHLWARMAAHHPIHVCHEHTARLYVHGQNTKDTVPDHTDQQENVFRQLMQIPDVRRGISDRFAKSRYLTFREWRIRKLEAKGERWALIRAILDFVVRHPMQPRNTAKLVMLLYAVPFGGLIRKAVSLVKGA